MKGLYKKISIGVLVSALVFGSSLSNKSAVNALDYAGPIYNVQDKINKKWVRCNLDDMRIVMGAYRIFDYDILYYNPNQRELEAMKNERPHVDKMLRQSSVKIYQNGNRFLYDLYKNGMKAGFYRIKVGKQSLMILFNKNIKRGIKWWEYLDKWAFPSNEFLRSIRIMH